MAYGHRKKRHHHLSAASTPSYPHNITTQHITKTTRPANIRGQPSQLRDRRYVEWIAVGGAVLVAIGLFKMLR